MTPGGQGGAGQSPRLVQDGGHIDWVLRHTVDCAPWQQGIKYLNTLCGCGGCLRDGPRPVDPPNVSTGAFFSDYLCLFCGDDRAGCSCFACGRLGLGGRQSDRSDHFIGVDYFRRLSHECHGYAGWRSKYCDPISIYQLVLGAVVGVAVVWRVASAPDF